MHTRSNIRTRNITNSVYDGQEYVAGKTGTFDYGPKFNSGPSYHTTQRTSGYTKAYEEASKPYSKNTTSQGMASALGYQQISKYPNNRSTSSVANKVGAGVTDYGTRMNPTASNKVEKPGVNFDSFSKKPSQSYYTKEEVKDDQSGYSRSKVSPFSGLRNIGNTCFMYFFFLIKELYSSGTFSFASTGSSFSWEFLEIFSEEFT